MPRRPRLHLPGIPQHLIQRGVDRRPIFFADGDYHYFLDWLGVYARARGIAIHAYCLMTNHIHLLVSSPSSGGLGGLMQDIGRRYVPYINRAYHKSGGLWQGRYKASFIQTDQYLLSCMRYIELNPVRADLVAAPEKYRWSSYRVNALGVAGTLITPHEVYLALDADIDARIQAYRDLFVNHGDDPAWDEIRVATQQGAMAGENGFVEMIEQRMGLALKPHPRGRQPQAENTKDQR